jgi:nitroimidazol reductase NimA-like FMN-containing flavoprotein (pyridoxamine 5'-phosphate oxidase superfamily)
MTHEHDLGTLARSIIDSNRYMTLGTADESGQPWVSPVWYATAAYREFFWVSSPNAKHSRNLQRRPQLAIVIFDSHRAGGWNALYMSAVAEELVDVRDGIEAFSRRSEAQGMRAWTQEDVLSPARHRLYRATAAEHFVLDPHDRRLPASVEGYQTSPSRQSQMSSPPRSKGTESGST